MKVRIGLGGASAMARGGRDTFFEYLDAAENNGWDSVWFSDRIAEPAWVMDPIVGMAMGVARTKRLQFGTGVLIMSMRSPVTTARALAAIDAMAGGRLVAGVGVGRESDMEYEAMGVQKADRGRRLNEAIRVMRLLWTKDTVDYDGQFLKLKGASITPKPARNPLPIWIGGRSEAALRRTGHLGDGWLPVQLTPEEAAKDIARIKEYATEAGRSIDDDHFGVQLGSYVVEHGSVDMDKIGQRLLRRRQDVSFEQLNLLGTADQVLARMREYIDAGISKFVFNPACGPEEVLAQMEIQAELVVKAHHPVKA
jgi:probable F420-dependent oxidoreductase